MELYGTEWFGLVADTFVGAVIHIHKPWLPIASECGVVNCISMVLRCDEASVRADHAYRLVMASVTVFQLIGAAAGGQSRQLVAQADAEHGHPAQELTDLLQGNGKSLAEYLASPVAMETVDTYPIATYGSAMAPFYTVLAQWVGTLLCATFLKVGYKPRPELERPSLAAHFFGRYGIFLLVGLAQAVIVAAGDLLYVQIQCLYPWKFLLAACVNGLVFSLINYAMVFALDNIGMALDVILLVVQVAGAGGTYPVEVLPEIFQKLNPYMPFRYAMDAMRECVAGSYGTNYWKDLGILLIFLVVFTVLGLALYRPAKGLNRLIAQSKNRTGIMV